MIHVIRFAGELNVFHYCHSSEEVGGEGRRGCQRSPPRGSQSRADTLAADTREPRCTSPTPDAFVRGPCVCVPSPCSISELVDPRAVSPASSTARSLRSSAAGNLAPLAAQRDTYDSRSPADGSADRRRDYCLRTHGECDRSLHARA